MTLLKPGITTIGFVALASSVLAANIEIARKIQTDKAIQGYLLVDQKVICYTLELPDRDNAPYVSAIPAGTYTGKVRIDGKLGWRIELHGVPDREAIEIHVGNYPKNTVGCTLVGTDATVDPPAVVNSRDALILIRDAISNSVDQAITVVYSDAPTKR